MKIVNAIFFVLSASLPHAANASSVSIDKISACQDAGRYANYYGGITDTTHCFESAADAGLIRACMQQSRYNNVKFDDCLDTGASAALTEACGDEYRYNRVNFFDCVKTNAPVEIVKACGDAKRYSGSSFFVCVSASHRP